MSDLRFHDLKRRRSPRRLKRPKKIAKKFWLTRWSCQPGTYIDSTWSLWGQQCMNSCNWFGLVHTHNPRFHDIFFIAEYAQLLWISNCIKKIKKNNLLVRFYKLLFRYQKLTVMLLIVKMVWSLARYSVYFGATML